MVDASSSGADHTFLGLTVDEGFDINVDHHGEVCIMWLRGEIDVAAAPELREKLLGLIVDGCRQLAINATAVNFIDAMGIGVIAHAADRMAKLGGRLAIAGAPEHVRSVFELSGLQGLLL